MRKLLLLIEKCDKKCPYFDAGQGHGYWWCNCKKANKTINDSHFKGPADGGFPDFCPLADESVLKPKVEPKVYTFKDVHTEHCCIVHGCKYGLSSAGCTVCDGIAPQSYPCESCEHEPVRPVGQPVMRGLNIEWLHEKFEQVKKEKEESG